MDEKCFDLLKLKDTLKTIPNDHYQEIYDDVAAELEWGNFNQSELFRHCIKVCHKIFELSEFRYGKATKNIPSDFWEDISTLYFEKCCRDLSDEVSLGEKYSYSASCLSYPEGDFSIADLATIILGKDDDSFSRHIKRIELWKTNRHYLRKFFGVKFNDKSKSPCEKYETLRLLKILHDCINECNVDLGYLLRMSVSKQNFKMPNSYSKALDFIKERIITRDIHTDCYMYFKTVMELENYNNAVRSFINSFSEGIIEYFLQHVNEPCGKIVRFICESVYRSVLKNLRELPHSSSDKITDAIAIQYYAYEHFLVTDIIDEEYDSFYARRFVVEAEESFYSRVAEFLAFCKIDLISLDNISAFAGKYKQELTKIFYPDIENDAELRKFYVRIERHKDDYINICRIYNLGINRDEFSELSGSEVVATVYLYEYLSDRGINIPLHSGYISVYEDKKKRRDLKIKALVKQICARFENQKTSAPLSDEEYFLACDWLTEQMYMLVNYRTVAIQSLRETMKSELLKYWRETIPLLTETGYTVQLEMLIENILPKSQQREILDRAIQIQCS